MMREFWYWMGFVVRVSDDIWIVVLCVEVEEGDKLMFVESFVFFLISNFL